MAIDFGERQMLTKQMRELKKQTLAECKRNGTTVSEDLIRAKIYAGEQAIWVERWIARQRIPWGGYGLAVVCALGGTAFGVLLQRTLG